MAGGKLQDKARAARNDVYRQHILESAEQVFAENGFDNAKLQDISKLAEVSMGTIYAIFAGKEELFRGILDTRGTDLLEVARASTQADGDPRAALDRLLVAYIDYFLAHPSFLRMHLRLGTSWVLGPSMSGEAQVRLWREIHTLQADLMQRGVAAGVFVDEDPAFLAKVFSALDQVLLADWVADGMKAPRDAVVARMRRLVERSILRTEDEGRRTKD